MSLNHSPFESAHYFLHYIKTTSLSHKRLWTTQHSQCSVLAQIMRLVKVTARLVFYSQTAEVTWLACHANLQVLTGGTAVFALPCSRLFTPNLSQLLCMSSQGDLLILQGIYFILGGITLPIFLCYVSCFLQKYASAAHWAALSYNTVNFLDNDYIYIISLCFNLSEHPCEHADHLDIRLSQQTFRLKCKTTEQMKGSLGNLWQTLGLLV